MHINNNVVDKRALLVFAALCSFVVTFMNSSVNIALPSIGNEFRMDAILLSWVVTSYILTSAIFLLPFGRLADIHGRKRVLTYGVFIFIIASALVPLAPSANLLISLRAVQGIGAAMLFANTTAIVTSVFPRGERGKAFGVVIAMGYLGLSSGPILGGLLTQHFGWRSIFWLTVLLGIAIIVLVFKKIKGEWADARAEKFDIPSSVIYGLSIAGIVYGLSLLPSMQGIWIFIAGAAGISAFVKRQMKVRNPILDINLFRKNRVFAFSNLAALFNYGALIAVVFYLSLYLQYIKGLDPQSAGLILVVMPALQAIFSPIAGRLSDRIEPRKLASIGTGLVAVGLSLLIPLKEDTSLGLIIPSLILLGFGFAFFSSPNANAIMSSVEQKVYGVAAAMMSTMAKFGPMLNMAIAMMLFAIYIGRVEITPEYYPQFLISAKTAFIIFTALCSVGIFASLVRDKTR